MGYQTLCVGSDCVTVHCWDSFMISFETNSDGQSCDPWNFHADGVADYVAGVYTPSGDGVAFAATRQLAGIERISCCEDNYAVIDPNPSFEGVFARNDLLLRIQKVHGGPRGPSGDCWVCYEGMATLDSVSLNISYTSGLADENQAWGSVKALYR